MVGRRKLQGRRYVLEAIRTQPADTAAPGTPYDELELHDADHPSHKRHRHHHEEKGWKKWFIGRRVLFPL